MYKFSHTRTCICGWVHVIQAPASCWVCQQKLDTIPMNHNRQVYQDLSAMRWSEGRNEFDTQRSLDRDSHAMGWPDEAGLGRENRFGFGGMTDDRDVNKGLVPRRR